MAGGEVHVSFAASSQTLFSMPSKVMIIVIEVMFLGINMFWALLRLTLGLA